MRYFFTVLAFFRVGMQIKGVVVDEFGNAIENAYIVNTNSKHTYYE
jgi:hypothetical protein